MSFKVLLNSKNAKMPQFKDGGYELIASEDYDMIPNVPAIVPTGISMSFPKNYCALLTRHSHKLLGGLIDSDYRGEIKVLLISKSEQKIAKGDVIARMQMIEVECPVIKFEQEYPPDSRVDVK